MVRARAGMAACARLYVRVLRDIGDWEVAFSKVEYAGADYKRAWQYLGEVPEGVELRKQWFTATIYVLSEPISLLGLSQEPNAPSGHVLVKFDLDKYGHTSNPTIIESAPAGLKDEAVLLIHQEFHAAPAPTSIQLSVLARCGQGQGRQGRQAVAAG